MLLCPVSLTWMDSQGGPLSKRQLSIASTTSVNTVMEAFTRTPEDCWGSQPTSSLILGWRNSPKGTWICEAKFLLTEGQRTISTPGPGTLTCCITAVYHLSPLPLVPILRFTDFSCSAALLLKVSFPFYSIIFKTISLISFQDMSSPPF